MTGVLAAVMLAFPWLPAPTVSCHDRVTYDGGRTATALYWPHLREIQLEKRTCRTLRKAFYGRPVNRVLAAYAVYVLAHELAHHAGVDSERAATCQGLRWVKRVARALGFERTYGLRARAKRIVNGAHVGVYTCRRLNGR